MKKIIKSNNILTKFAAKSVLSSILLTTALLLLFSKIILCLDLDIVYYNVFSITTIFIVSLLTPIISVGKINNNIFMMSILSNSLLIILTIINAFSIKNIILTVLEIVTIIFASLLSSLIIKKNKSGFKV